MFNGSLHEGAPVKRLKRDSPNWQQIAIIN